MLSALGWDAHFERAFAPFAPVLSPARIVTQHRSEYIAAGATGVFSATLAGRLRNRGEIPAVGDWVAVAVSTASARASIRGLVPRRTAFVRKAPGRETAPQVIAANIDVALIVVPLDGGLNARRLERYLAVAWESGALPSIVLSKADLCPDLATAVAEVRLIAPGVEITPVSILSGQGMADLERHLVAPHTVALIGASGVGKSTLANALLGEDRLATGAVDADGRGRHTTTRRELVQLPSGALLIDTPGMRELGLLTDGDGIDTAFAEIEPLAAGCRFADCAHDAEPDCAVRGVVPADRLRQWRGLQREAARSHDKMLSRALRARLREKYD